MKTSNISCVYCFSRSLFAIINHDWTEFHKYNEDAEFEFVSRCQIFLHTLTLPYRHASTHPHAGARSWNILALAGVTQLHATY